MVGFRLMMSANFSSFQQLRAKLSLLAWSRVSLHVDQTDAGTSTGIAGTEHPAGQWLFNRTINFKRQSKCSAVKVRARPSGFCFRLQYFSLGLLTVGASIGVLTHRTLGSDKVNCVCISSKCSCNDGVLWPIEEGCLCSVSPRRKSLYTAKRQNFFIHI